MKKILTIAALLTVLATSATAQDATAPAAAPATTATEAVTSAATAVTEAATDVAKTVTDAAKPAETAPATPGVPAAAPADATAVPATEEKKDESQPTAENPLENTLYLELKDGRVVIQLMPEVAPNHVKRIKELVRQGFYDGVPFHRVIDGFMAQTGDPTGTGTGGSGTKIDAEFNAEKHVRGTVAMARAADPNSADSQFFIVFQEAPHLDGNYTAFGKVTEGMELVDKIKKGSGPNGMVSDPDKIIKLKVAADEKPADAATTAPAAPAATPAAEPAKQ